MVKLTPGQQAVPPSASAALQAMPHQGAEHDSGRWRSPLPGQGADLPGFRSDPPVLRSDLPGLSTSLPG